MLCPHLYGFETIGGVQLSLDQINAPGACLIGLMVREVAYTSGDEEEAAHSVPTSAGPMASILLSTL